MRPQLDKVYVYQPRERSIMHGSFPKINKRTEPDYKFLRGNIPDRAQVYRYALTIEINDAKRTILMITLDKNQTRVSKFFAQAKEDIEADASILRSYILATQKPVELPIQYVY
jgi:hypothetical protein